MSSDSEYGECEPGAGGYQVAVYKNNNIKKLQPLNEDSYKYVKSKFKKHSSSYKPTAAAGAVSKKSAKPKAKSPKEVKKEAVAATATAKGGGGDVKPKRVMTEKQKEALAEGRKKRAAQLAEQKKNSK